MTLIIYGWPPSFQQCAFNNAFPPKSISLFLIIFLLFAQVLARIKIDRFVCAFRCCLSAQHVANNSVIVPFFKAGNVTKLIIELQDAKKGPFYRTELAEKL